MSHLRKCVIRSFAGIAAFAVAGPAAAQQVPPGAEEMMRLMQAGQMPGGIPGMAPQQIQEGTWVYPVSAGLHESMIETGDIGDADGIDGDFMARSSLQAVFTAAGEPPACEGSNRPDMRGRLRVLAMEVWTGSGPFMGGAQESRLIVNQELSRAVLYLHGDVREWVPGPTTCEDGRLVEGSSGRGLLRMEYETTMHVAPLNFSAFPSAGDVDPADLQAACHAMRDMAFQAYQDMNSRWNLISHDHNAPLDWSVLTPVEAGYGDGNHASFANGLFNTAEVVNAAATASDAVSLGTDLGNAFSRAPSVAAAGAAGVGQWVVMQAVEPVLNTAGVQTMSPTEFVMGMAMMGHNVFSGSGDPAVRGVADYARQRLPGPNGPYQGINVDYMVHTLFEACESLNPDDPLTGFAAGHFSWPGGTVILSGRGLAPNEPAAIASGPVQSGSVADALALAQSMGAEIPEMAEIEAQLPPGMSLDALPAPMAGRAGGGGTLTSNTPEWTVSYNVQIIDEGERIAALWFDPRR